MEKVVLGIGIGILAMAVFAYFWPVQAILKVITLQF